MNDLAQVLGKIPSGLFILTVRHGEQRTGILVSWVMQASFDPPAFTVAIRKGRYIAEWLGNGAEVALNVLGEDDNASLSHFGAGFEPEQDAFEGVALLAESDRLPILADALGYLEGTVRSSLDAGDHLVFAIEIKSGRLLADIKPRVHLRKDGLRY